MNSEMIYDVIVVGGGHAGTEAALAAARMGAKTLLLTHNLDMLGQMSCNPAIGGIGKGHLVKEIDALGGIMGIAADYAGIHFRTLNGSKGPAVRATRAQTDRIRYRRAIRNKLQHQPGLYLFQQAVHDLIIENNRVTGIITQMGLVLKAHAVVLTVGTFLDGKIHIGTSQYGAGRAGCPPAISLAQKLREMNLPVGRLKTGTPPRIDQRSVNFSKMTIQEGDKPITPFSYLGNSKELPRQVPCYITSTTEKTHEIIRNNLARSAMYSGAIEGIGPRYCPSIEDKITRFADKSSHQIFLEPEGLTCTELYPNGISTSLPFDVQEQFVRTIIGCENAYITRPGYAIEYDYFDPRGLTTYLQTKHIPNLFFAGQINGTTGYEEAAAQGLIAGMNAALLLQEKTLWCPKRHEAYIGVLIDDLITRGTLEPYRMFTSRAEYRLLLREDNADLRLTEHGRTLGLVDDQRWKAFSEKKETLEKVQNQLKETWIRVQHNISLSSIIAKPLQQDCTAHDFLKRPEVHYQNLLALEDLNLPIIPLPIAEQVDVQIKYSGYIERQQQEIDRFQQHESTLLPANFDYQQIVGLSNEVMQKLLKVRPNTLGQASRISGVTPAALSLLLVYLKKQKIKNKEHNESL